MAIKEIKSQKLGRRSESGLYRDTLLLMERKGPLTQKQFADEMGVTLPAAFTRFQKLDDYGLIKPLKVSHTPKRGRPVKLWDIDRDNNFAIGVCVEPPEVLLGLSDFDDNLILTEKYDLSEAKSLDDFTDILDTFVRKCRARIDGNVRAACVCMSGNVTYQTGVKVEEKNVNMPFLSGFDSRNHFSSNYEIDCWPRTLGAATCFGEMDNLPEDTLVAVIGWNLGVGIRPCRNNEMLFFDQKAGHTKLGMRDMGHIRVRKGGKNCRCGQNGCLEAYTGGWALIEKLNRPDVKKLSDLIELASEGDSEVIAALNEAAEFLGEQLVWFVQFMGVEKIVFTGPLSGVFSVVKEAFCEGLRSRLTDSEIEFLDPVASLDPTKNMLSGACRAARHMYFNKHELAI